MYSGDYGSQRRPISGIALVLEMQMIKERSERNGN